MHNFSPLSLLRAQIEFLARSTRNFLIVLHVIRIYICSQISLQSTFYTNRLSTAVKFREKTKAHLGERKTSEKKNFVNEGVGVCYDSSLFLSSSLLRRFFSSLSITPRILE